MTRALSQPDKVALTNSGTDSPKVSSEHKPATSESMIFSSSLTAVDSRETNQKALAEETSDDDSC